MDESEILAKGQQPYESNLPIEEQAQEIIEGLLRGKLRRRHSMTVAKRSCGPRPLLQKEAHRSLFGVFQEARKARERIARFS